jgi:hypothetical protein
MSAHRMHTLDIPIEPTLIPQAEVRVPDQRLAFAAYFVAAATVVGAAVAISINGMPPAATPIKPAHVSTVPLPSADEIHVQRFTIDRLRDWRAGYEAAVENGCQLRPLLNPPVGAHP